MDKDHEGGEVFPIMKNFTDRKVRKLNYIVHNPNTVEETAKVLLEICILDSRKRDDEILVMQF